MLILVLFFIIAVGAMVGLAFVGVSQDSLWLQALNQILVFGGAAVVFALLFYGNPVEYLKLRLPERLWRKLLGAMLILVCLVPVSDWLGLVNESWHLPQGLSLLEEKLRQMEADSQLLLERYFSDRSVGGFLINVFVLALLPALCEELLFRGAMQQVLTSWTRNHHAAIFITAALFSLFHGEVFLFLPRFVLGLALGYLFFYGGSLWINSAVHFVNNLMAIALYYLAEGGFVDPQAAESFNSPWYLALVGLAGAVFVFWLTFRNGEKRFD